MDKENSQIENEQADKSRRDFIEKAGKVAIVAPAAAILLSTASQSVHATYHGGGMSGP